MNARGELESVRFRRKGMPMGLKIRVVGGMIEREGRYLIAQRKPRAIFPLLWEFPGGKVEPGETDEAALARELREKLGIEVAVLERAVHVEHRYEGYDIDFCVYRCLEASGEVQHLGVHDHRWVHPRELDGYEFPPADEKSIALLLGL
jgi:8-oxo-dGTP diphosphatase